MIEKRNKNYISDGVLKVEKGWTLVDTMRVDIIRIRRCGYADTDARIRIRGYGYADTDTRVRIRGYGYADTDMRIGIRGYRYVDTDTDTDMRDTDMRICICGYEDTRLLYIYV